ncbi:MAG: hypothetical protein ACJ8AB_06850 [Gemmatimonadaceae bacterium]
MTRALPIVLAALMVLGCATLPPVDPVVQRDWDRTLFYARQDVDSGNYFAADKLLDEFVRVHPDTRLAQEIAFWKGAYLVDPMNERGSLEAGIAALDGYLSTNPVGRYRDAATVLRRTAAVAQGIIGPPRATTVVDTVQVPAQTQAKDTVVIVKSRDEQIAALRDQLARSKEELAKVSAELERIKKRLANPSS